MWILETKKETQLFSFQQGYQSSLEKLKEVPGIDFNMKDKDGDTAAIVAVKKGHLESLKVLTAMP